MALHVVCHSVTCHTCYLYSIYAQYFMLGVGSGAVVKAACLKSRRARLRTPLWPSSLEETNVSSPLPRKSLILWGASVTGRYRARPLTTRGRIVSVESYVWSVVSSHHPEDVLLAQSSLYVHKVGLKSY